MRSLPLQVVDSLKTAADRLKQTKVLVGFDGFVDTILHVVKTRESASKYTRVERMTEFSEKIAEAAGRSANMEMVVQMRKLGGNGPIMANALGAYSTEVTYIGNLGYPAVHPVFAEFAKKASVFSVAEPGYTDAIEFDDGKLMFGKHESLKEVNWANLIAQIPEAKLVKIFAQSSFIAMVNWTMLTQMKGIFQKVASVIAPKLKGERRTLFFDLADPAKRSREDIAEALKQIAKFEKHFRVVLGMNFSESQQVGEVLGLRAPTETHDAVRQHAVAIRELLKIDKVVIHPTHFAAAADAQGSACVEGPFTAKPKITTGAGDHFNAGFSLGCILKLSLEESLQIGVATSGFYVRNAKSPTLNDLKKFLKTL
jgi:hypothetical protein